MHARPQCPSPVLVAPNLRAPVCAPVCANVPVRLTAPACLSSLLALALSACGGGGGGGGVVRGDPPPPPPPPTPAPPQYCPAPVTADCVVDVPYTPTFAEIEMTGGRQSDHALVKRGPGWLSLFGTYRFSGGTRIEQGSLIVRDTLQSNVRINPSAELWLVGRVQGEVNNAGVMTFRTLCDGSSPCESVMRATVDGDYIQTRDAELEAVLGWTLQVTGHAELDGLLRLTGQRVTGSSQYLLPAAPSTQVILHAGNGVTGQFQDWSAPGLFINGTLRYDANNVFFDLTRASMTAVMSAASGDAGVLASARHLDDAFRHADAFALAPAASLDDTQRRFLESAGAVQHIADPAQAAATLDSLSGQAHATATSLLLEQALLPSPRLAARLDRLQYGERAGAWSDRTAAIGQLAHAGRPGARFDASGQLSGHDQWLGDRLLLGSSVEWTDASMAFDRLGGSVRSHAPRWNAYLRYRGDRDWYASGVIGASHARLTVDRPLVLAAAGLRHAHARRDLSLANAYLEGGRGVEVGGGRLTPFASLGYASLATDGFRESGDSGFELVADASRQRLATAGVGARYARDWRRGADGWVRLDLDGRYQQRIAGDGDPLQAAFAGTPLARFAVDGTPVAPTYGALGLGLSGGAGADDGSWVFQYDRVLRGTQRGAAWSLGWSLRF